MMWKVAFFSFAGDLVWMSAFDSKEERDTDIAQSLHFWHGEPLIVKVLDPDCDEWYRVA